MPEYGFPLTRIFPYKDKIYDYVFIREDTGQRKPVFWNILHSESLTLRNTCEQHISNKRIDVLPHSSDLPDSFPYTN